MEIEGATALVLGATRGIGRALADRLASMGAKLIIPYFDWPDDSRETIKQLRENDHNHIFVKTDLRDPKQVKNLFHSIQEKHNSLSILINNIERGGMPVVHGPYTPEQWDLEIDTTMKAKWLVFQEALPMLRKSPEAAVVTLSSIAGIVGRSGPGALVFNEGYAAANRAVSSFTETWARQGAPNIRVNELMLGFIENRHGEGTRGWELLSREAKQAIYDHSLMGRTGTLQEVCDAVMFLLKNATFITGTTLRLDGGYSIGHSKVPTMPIGEDDVTIKM